MLLHGATKLWGAWRGIFEWLDTGGGIAGRRHLGLVGVHLWERTRTTPIGGGFVIEVLVIAAAQIQHRVKSVYMDYLLDVPPAGPPFQHLVARGVGASPAWPGVFRKTLFYPRRLQTERAPKPAKRGFFLLITTPWMSWHGLGGQ